MKIEIEVASVKMLGESLRLAEAAMNTAPMNIANSAKRHVANLIKELDKHRPLGPDGKHGDLHTETCGCSDK